MKKPRITLQKWYEEMDKISIKTSELRRQLLEKGTDLGQIENIKETRKKLEELETLAKELTNLKPQGESIDPKVFDKFMGKEEDTQN